MTTMTKPFQILALGLFLAASAVAAGAAISVASILMCVTALSSESRLGLTFTMRGGPLAARPSRLCGWASFGTWRELAGHSPGMKTTERLETLATHLARRC